jgi:hypothetical protein
MSLLAGYRNAVAVDKEGGVGEVTTGRPAIGLTARVREVHPRQPGRGGVDGNEVSNRVVDAAFGVLDGHSRLVAIED